MTPSSSSARLLIAGSFGQFVENKISAAYDTMEAELETLRHNCYICEETRRHAIDAVYDKFLNETVSDKTSHHKLEL